MAISRPSIDNDEKYLSLALLFFLTTLFLILWHYFPPLLEFLNTVKPLMFCFNVLSFSTRLSASGTNITFIINEITII